MKIESSIIGMESSRSYESMEFTRIKSENTNWLTEPKQQSDKHDTLASEDGLSKLSNDTKKLLEDQNSQVNSQTTANTALNSKTGKIDAKFELSAANTQECSFSASNIEDYKLTLLRKMLELLSKFKHKNGFSYGSMTEQSQETYKSLSLSFESSQFGFASGAQSMHIGNKAPAPGLWVRDISATHFFSEQESTTFTSSGIAKTQDGREICFGIDLEMSRSFMEYTSLEWREALMTDPLVINLNTSHTSLSNQKFTFDIDNDGKEDNISYLNKGSGYLALDKNDDGKINDGGELFGAKTGNGFAELSTYDSDKNGWIDENDEIYNKLKVWIKTEDGTDRLIDLKNADIGAIYLGNNKTDFTLKSEKNGQVNGQIRRTGLYLKESTGQAQTVQQIDVTA